MNRQEIIIVVLLVLALFGWLYIQTPPGGARVSSGNAETTAGVDQVEEQMDAAEEVLDVVDAGTSVPDEVLVEQRIVENQKEEVDILLPEERIAVGNDEMSVTVSSRGGSIVSVELKEYMESLEPESGAVCLDFSEKPSLSLKGLPGLSVDDDFNVSVDDADKSIHIERITPEGLRFERRIVLAGNYRIAVTDVLSNTASMKLDIPAYHVGIGPMQAIRTKAKSRGVISYLDIDTMSSIGAKDVTRWGNKGPDDRDPGKKISLVERFQPEGRRGSGCIGKQKLTMPLPESIAVQHDSDIDWLAVKNKFFVQILALDNGGSGCELTAIREVPDRERAEDSRTWAQVASIAEISAAVRVKGHVLQPGESAVSVMSFYVGPKKFSLLEKLGKRQDEVMFHAWPGCGWFRWLCKQLLWTLNLMYAFIPNYGIAIILLTIIVKVVFWPVTHKSTESMKKMQKIQPLVNELREKYKDNPQKLQKETMSLYKEHKVNPMMGCLPMLIQIPVFIALFTVLRSAIELRYSGFLWVNDLSEPEGLLLGVLPGSLTLNILPILMTVTMIFQQRLTPSGGDSQQQKMMAFMPVMFLFMLYNMASGLMLYWTVSQSLSIAQLLIQRYKAKAEKA